MGEPLVSVIMPSYNTGRIICESIDSILSQTYTNLELLISDDHSSDAETVSILKNYASRDSRVKVFFLEENGGAGIARNNSIRHAKGRYIAFCDSDDRWLPDKLEKQLALMKEKDCCLCHSSYFTCNFEGEINGYVTAPRTLTLREEKRDNKVGCSTAIYDTEKCGKFYMPSLRKRQDWALFLGILKECHKAYAIQEPLAIYRKVPGSISSNKFDLIKYNAKVYQEVFGYSKLHAYAYLFLVFFPNYFTKRIKKKVANSKSKTLSDSSTKEDNSFPVKEGRGELGKGLGRGTGGAALFLLLFFLSSFLLTAKPITYVWNINQLKTLVNNPSLPDSKKIIQRANDMIRQQPVAVTDKTVCISGNKHNYESLAGYYWPDPKNPGGPYISKDGQPNPEADKYDYRRLLQLNEECRYLSKAFYITGDTKYHEALLNRLDAWFLLEESRMVPNMEYSQFIPGRSGGKGVPGGVLDAYRFVDIIESTLLTDHLKSIGRKRRKSLRKWFDALGTWMLTSPNGEKARTLPNNHAIAYSGTLMEIGLFTKNKQMQREAIAWFVRNVDGQIDAEGKMPKELTRNNAFTYSIFNLQHIVEAGLMIKNSGAKLPASCEAKIRKSADYLSSYIGRKEAFPYREIGNWDSQETNLKRVLYQMKLGGLK